MKNKNYKWTVKEVVICAVNRDITKEIALKIRCLRFSATNVISLGIWPGIATTAKIAMTNAITVANSVTLPKIATRTTTTGRAM